MKKLPWILGAAALLTVAVAWGPSLADQNSWVVHVDDDRAYLGVSLEEELDHDEGGARVTRVVEDSPAARAGLEAGDVIVGFEGRTIRGPRALSRALGDREAGDEVTVRYLRNGRERKATVELTSRGEMGRVYAVSPESAEQWAEFGEAWAERAEEFGEEWAEWGERFGEQFGQQFGQVWADENGATTFFRQNCDEDDDCAHNLRFMVAGSRPRLGVHLVETTAELREHLGGSRDEGVLVSRVVDDSTAEAAGVEVGDLILSVDGESVRSSGELRRVLREVAGRTVDIVVSRDGRRQTLSASFPEADEQGLFGPRASLAPLPALPSVPAPPALAEIPLPEVPSVAPVAPRMLPRGLRDSVRELRGEQRRAIAEVRREAREALREARGLTRSVM